MMARTGTQAAAGALVLASASPRRLELLRQIGVVPSRTMPADVDESPGKAELPLAHAGRLARTKAEAIATRLREAEPGHDSFILAADTVVALGRRILPKAETGAQVRDCLILLSGRAHQVITAVTIIAPDGRSASRSVTTRVSFKRLDQTEIAHYLQSGEGLGKAGGYAIQGLAAAYIRQLSGSYSGVVGLPLYETSQMLRGLGFALAEPGA
jgi:septum formation protein